MWVSVFVLVASIAVPRLAAPQPPQRAADPNVARAQLHYRLGWDALRSEDWNAAVKEFQAAVDLHPKFALAYYGLGKAHMGLRRYPNAVAAFEACRDIYTAQGGARFSGQADATRARQDRMMELEELQRQFSKGPQTPQAQDTQRLIQNAMRVTQDATDRGISLNIDASAPAFVSVALGSAYFRAERIADAERAYREAIADDPRAGEAHNNLAVVYMLTGRLDDSTREVALAEKAGFRVNPQFKKDLEEKRRGKS